MSQPDEALTVSEAAVQLQRTPRTLYRWMAQGQLPYVVRHDGRRVIATDIVIAMSRTCRRTVSPSTADDPGLRQRLDGLERGQVRVLGLLHDMLRLIPAESLDALQRKQQLRDRLDTLVLEQRAHHHC